MTNNGRSSSRSPYKLSEIFDLHWRHKYLIVNDSPHPKWPSCHASQQHIKPTSESESKSMSKSRHPSCGCGLEANGFIDRAKVQDEGGQPSLKISHLNKPETDSSFRCQSPEKSASQKRDNDLRSRDQILCAKGHSQTQCRCLTLYHPYSTVCTSLGV